MLFGRLAVLQIGIPGTTGRSFSSADGFRLTFDINMSATGDPNAGTIEAYNLAPESIALVQDPACEVRLLVGYADGTSLVFVGNPIPGGATRKRQGPDVILHIEAADGGRAYGEARCSISFATATTAQQVLDEILRQTGLTAGTVRVPDFTFQAGYVYQGQGADALAQLAATVGATCYIRDGVIVFYETGGDTGEQAVVLSSAAGNLIGSPSPKDDGKLEVVALIAASIRPGRVFSVESEDYNGLYVAEDVAFKGDTHGQEWYVRVTGSVRS